MKIVPFALGELICIKPLLNGAKVGGGGAFASRTGGLAAIGALAELPQILTGKAGTHISQSHTGILWPSETG